VFFQDIRPGKKSTIIVIMRMSEKHIASSFRVKKKSASGQLESAGGCRLILSGKKTIYMYKNREGGSVDHMGSKQIGEGYGLC
jgi:hypothetical protein